MIADAVAGAEILVGGIIKHTPAEAARMLSICVGGVQHPRMAQGMLLPVRGIVTGLGGVHVPVAFGNQQCLAQIRRYILFPLGPGV